MDVEKCKEFDSIVDNLKEHMEGIDSIMILYVFSLLMKVMAESCKGKLDLEMSIGTIGSLRSLKG